MGQLKFFDDPPQSLKFRDDLPPITIKFIDDHRGGATLKFMDDHRTFKFTDQGSTKRFDDVKFFGYDKFVGQDVPYHPEYEFDPMPFGAQPFILSTPHHSMDWAKSMGYETPDMNDPDVQKKQFDEYIGQLTEYRAQLQKQIEQLDEHVKASKKEFDEFTKKSASKK